MAAGSESVRDGWVVSVSDLTPRNCVGGNGSLAYLNGRESAIMHMQAAQTCWTTVRGRPCHVLNDNLTLQRV